MERSEVLAGLLNLRDHPNGAILAKLSRGAELVATGAVVADAAMEPWLPVNLPGTKIMGCVCERFVSIHDKSSPFNYPFQLTVLYVL